MPTFAFSARGANGSTVQNSLTANSRRDALKQLASRGLKPIQLSEAGGEIEAGKGKGAAKSQFSFSLSSFGGGGEVKLKRKHRLPGLIAIHELTASGLSAGEAIRLLSARVKEPAMQQLMSGLWAQISEGATLSRAMAAYPDVFEESGLNLIQAGEATGNLNEVFERLIVHYTEQKEMQSKLLASMAYPAFLSVVATGVVLFFLFFLLPKLEELFKSLKGDLPASTKLLIGMSGFAKSWGIPVVIVLVLGLVFFWRWRNTESGRKITDRWMLHVPLLGPFCVAQTVLNFSQGLSVLLENGITAADALRMTEKQVTNRVHREAFVEATNRVLEGEAMSKALARTGVFPDLVLDQLSIGENTGNIAPSLKRTAGNYQKVVSSRLDLFTKVIGNGVLMVVFIFVGFLAFAIVSAVFKLSASIKGG
jgi:general secretion pathway protein F